MGIHPIKFEKFVKKRQKNFEKSYFCLKVKKQEEGRVWKLKLSNRRVKR